MALIYSITNPLGEVYIGSTTGSIKTRVSNHKSEYKLRRGGYPLHHSFDLHGFSSHVFEVIKECSKEERFDVEHTLISELSNTLNQVTKYNATAVGKVWVNDGVSEFQVHKKDIKSYKIGRLFDVSKMGKANLGRKRTKEQLVNMLKSKVKEVKCFIASSPPLIFSSTKEASRQLGLDSSSIAKVCRGVNQSCGGFHFKYN